MYPNPLHSLILHRHFKIGSNPIFSSSLQVLSYVLKITTTKKNSQERESWTVAKAVGRNPRPLVRRSTARVFSESALRGNPALLACPPEQNSSLARWGAYESAYLFLLRHSKGIHLREVMSFVCIQARLLHTQIILIFILLFIIIYLRFNVEKFLSKSESIKLICYI